MLNTRYKSLQIKFEELISNSKIDNQHAFLFDTLIKSKIIKNENGYYSQLNRLPKFNRFLAFLFSFLLKFSIKLSNNNSKILFINGHRHNKLFESILKVAKDNHLIVIQGIHLFNLKNFEIYIPLGKFINKIIPLRNMAICIDEKLKNSSSKLSIDYKYLNYCENLFINFFKSNQIKVLAFENGSYTPQSRFLIEIAKKCGVVTLVFAPGTNQHKSCIGFLPLVSDVFWVWNKKDYDQLLANCPKTLQMNIHLGGVPFKIESSKVQKEYFLFVSEQIRPYPDKEFLIYMNKIFKTIVNFNNNSKIKCLIRLHPKQKTIKTYLKKLAIYPLMKPFITDGDLKKNLERSYAVFGTNSTVLTESSSMNLNTYQLIEYSRSKIFGAKQIKIDQLLNTLSTFSSFDSRIKTHNDLELELKIVFEKLLKN